MPNNRFFKDAKISVKNFLKGIITDGADYPADSLQECVNLDLYHNRTRRRQPYTWQSTLPSGLTTGYNSIGIFNKLYTDASGVQKGVLVIVAKNTSSPGTLKIFTNKYFNPSTAYGNNHNGSANAWNETDFVELTETYPIGIPSTVTYTNSNKTVKITVTGNTAMQALPDNYYKGFFLSETASPYNMLGFVTKFVANNSGVSEFYIVLNLKVNIDGSNITTLALCEIPTVISHIVESVSISNTGTGFTAIPDISFSGGGAGTPAAATARLGVEVVSPVSGAFVDGYTYRTMEGTFSTSFRLTWNSFTNSFTIADRGKFSALPSNIANIGVYDENYPPPDIPGLIVNASGWLLTDVVMTSGGTGYTSTPTVKAMQGADERSSVLVAHLNSAYLSVTISRFPVNIFNTDSWNNITEVSFEESATALKIACGHDSRTLWLGFLAEKQFFSTQANLYPGTDYEYCRNWNGFWFSYDVPNITDKENAVAFSQYYHTYPTRKLIEYYPLEGLDNICIRYGNTIRFFL